MRGGGVRRWSALRIPTHFPVAGASADDSDGGTSLNFPQLRDDRELMAALCSAPDVTQLQTAVTSWMCLNWPQQGAALVAGRAEALRWVPIQQQWI